MEPWQGTNVGYQGHQLDFCKLYYSFFLSGFKTVIVNACFTLGEQKQEASPW